MRNRTFLLRVTTESHPEFPSQAPGEWHPAGRTVGYGGSPMTPLDGAVDVTAEGAAATTRKRILVVDDEADIRTLVATSLARAGFEVTQATDGPSALEAVNADPPDLIVLDLMMPGVPGLEVCKRLRAAPTTAHVPVI